LNCIKEEEEEEEEERYFKEYPKVAFQKPPKIRSCFTNIR
jgi:hypothetical protein